MSDEPPSIPTPHNQFDPLHGVEVPPPMGGPGHELWSIGHPTRGGPASIYPTMNHANHAGQARYNGNMGHDEPHHPAVTVHVGHRGNQTHTGGYPTVTGNNQYTPIRPEYRAPAAPVLNDTPTTRGPLLHHDVSGSSEGNHVLPHSRMSAAEDLKYLASQYLFRPGSQVDKLRVRRSRPGRFKVLILLEVEDDDEM